MNSEMAVGKKLLLSFAAIAVLIVVLAGVTFWGFHSMQSSFDRVSGVDFKKLQLIGDYTTASWMMRARYMAILLYGQTGKKEKIGGATDIYTKGVTDSRAALEQLGELVATAKEKELVAEAKKNLQAYHDVYLVVRKNLDEGKLEDAAAYSDKYSIPVGIRMAQIAPEITQLIKAAIAQDRRDVASEASVNRWTASVLLVLALAGSVWILCVVRQINRRLRQVTGDLAERTQQVSSAAAQISSSSQSLAQGASEQAASLEETSSSTEEVNSMTHKNAENSNNSAKLMDEMAGQVATGNRKLEEMVTSMHEINESSEKISKIIKTIDEIAFQTNILALNAAVEAARAGEAGMGFAVVADEVRNLAQRSAQAAKDTAGLIEDSIAKSQQGSRKLDEVSSAFAAITGEAEKVKTLVDEVHVGSEEQARGLEQIARAISAMEQVTQKTAAGAEESAAAGEEIRSQAEGLNRVVDSLTVWAGVDMQTMRAGASPAPPEKRQAAPASGDPKVRKAPVKAQAKLEHAPPVAAAAHAAREFPMEDDFKEF